MIGNLKAGFHLISTLSWSWSLNHKHTARGSNEYQSDQIGRKIILPLTTRSLTIQWKLSCQSHKWKNVPQGPENWHCDWLVFPFLLATDNLFHWIKSDRGISGIGRKWNSFDPSEYGSVELMTLLLTLIFSFHSVGSILQLHLFFFFNWNQLTMTKLNEEYFTVATSANQMPTERYSIIRPVKQIQYWENLIKRSRCNFTGKF